MDALTTTLIGTGLTYALSSAKGGASVGTSWTLYQPTASDYSTILSRYGDSKSTFKVNGQTLSAWLQQAVQTLQCPQGYNATEPYYSKYATANGTISQLGAASNLASAGAVEASAIGAKVTGQALTGALGSTLSAIPIIGSAIGLFTGVFSAISAHHAAAVNRENQIFVPFYFASLQQCQAIISELTTGQAKQTAVTQQGQTVVLSTSTVGLPDIQTAVSQYRSAAIANLNQDSSSGMLHAISEQVNAVCDTFDLIIAKTENPQAVAAASYAAAQPPSTNTLQTQLAKLGLGVI